MSEHIEMPEEQIKKVIVSLLKGQESASENEIRLVVEWAQDAWLNWHLLHLVLVGRIFIKMIGGEVGFVAPEEMVK